MTSLSNDFPSDQWNPSARDLLIANAVIAVAAIFAIGASLAALNGAVMFASLVLAASMLAIARIDFEQLRVPDMLSLPTLFLGLLASGSFSPNLDVLASAESLVGCVVGGGVFWGVRQAYWLLRGHHGLGLGDVKLAAAGGAWAGVHALPSVLMLACALALFAVTLGHCILRRFATAKTPLPFGSALAPSIWIIWFVDRIAS